MVSYMTSRAGAWWRRPLAGWGAMSLLFFWLRMCEEENLREAERHWFSGR